MSLKMRPTGLGHGVYKDHADYLIFCGGWNIGRIYEIRSGPEELRWFWALHFPGRPENLRTARVTGSGEGGIRGVLAQVEGVGRAGRGTLNSTYQPCSAAIPACPR